MNETSPAPTRVIVVPETSTVATFVLLLLYAMATPVLLLVGKALNEKDASPKVLDDATSNDDAESVDVARATLSVLLVIVAALY